MICTTCNGSGCVNIDDGNLSLGWIDCADCVLPSAKTGKPAASIFHPLPALTDDDYRRIAEESRACREAFEKASAGMERLTADDLRIVIR